MDSLRNDRTIFHYTEEITVGGITFRCVEVSSIVARGGSRIEAFRRFEEEVQRWRDERGWQYTIKAMCVKANYAIRFSA